MLETPRLRIRALTIADAPFVLALQSQPSWLRFIGDRGVHDLASAERYLIDGPIANRQQHGFALDLVELKESGAPIGVCGLIRRESLPHPDLGFALLDDYAGRGYAFEAASAVMAHARAALGLSTILAIATHDNARSAALLGRLGFVVDRAIDHEGTALDLYASTIALG